MTGIERDPSGASGARYDLIVVGGGIYGVMLALQASLRSLSVILLEKNDFGSGTTFNSLRTIHGGLRYLQRLDLARHRELAREQIWYLEHFPDLVRCQPVLMPLYGHGLRRPMVFRTALAVHSALSTLWTRGSTHPARPRGRVVGPTDVAGLFPGVDPRGLMGGGIWDEGFVEDQARMLIELILSAVDLGARTLNYVEVTEVLVGDGRVTGVRALDRTTSSVHEFEAGTVIDTTPGGLRGEAVDLPGSVAWNVLLDREPVSTCSLALRSPIDPHPTYFVHPWEGRLLAGTGHAPRTSPVTRPYPTDEELRGFLEGLDAALPGLSVGRRDVLHVFSGLLPVRKAGTVRLTVRERLLVPDPSEGLLGYVRLSGPRMTTARSAAERTITRIFPDRRPRPSARARFLRYRGERAAHAAEAVRLDALGEDSTAARLATIVETESVCHLDDLVLRRTKLGEDPARALAVAPDLCQLFDWSDDRCANERKRLRQHYAWLEGSTLLGPPPG